MGGAAPPPGHGVVVGLGQLGVLVVLVLQPGLVLLQLLVLIVQGVVQPPAPLDNVIEEKASNAGAGAVPVCNLPCRQT